MQDFENCAAGNHLNTYVMQVRDRLLVSKLVTKFYVQILNLCKVNDEKAKSIRLHAFKLYERKRHTEREEEWLCAFLNSAV
jgi:hypothetical protein